MSSWLRECVNDEQCMIGMRRTSFLACGDGKLGRVLGAWENAHELIFILVLHA